MSIIAKSRRLCLKASELLEPSEFSNNIYVTLATRMYDLIYTIKLNRLEQRIKETADAAEIFELIKQKNELTQSRQRWQEKK